MTLEEAIQILKKDRDLCLFNPMTGEKKPMNEDCRQSAEAYEVILKELERNKKTDGDDKLTISDKDAVKALQAAQFILAYLYNEECWSSNTEWVDTKGYAMECDLGYFYGGLENLVDLLVKRCRKAIPKYPKACEQYCMRGEDDG